MIKKICISLLCFLAVLFMGVNPAVADEDDDVDPNYGAKGISPYREYSSFIPNESIDPFTGGLTLTIPILSLPQNGGWNLNINLVYNSKIYKTQSFDTLAEDSWVGVGWTLHMGQLIAPGTETPIVEMGDGSSHPCYGSSVNGPWRTREDWLLERVDSNTYTLKLTDGTIYTFAFPGSTVVDSQTDPRNYYPATSIQDACNNVVEIVYDLVQTQSGTKAFINFISDASTPRRTIDFSSSADADGISQLNSITVHNRSYNFTYYTSDTLGRFKLLTHLNMPENATWQFCYDVTTPVVAELHELLTPNGARITYGFDTHSFTDSSVIPEKPLLYRVVTSKVISGDCTGGSWNYGYSMENNMHKTTITCPEGKKEEYLFHGYRTLDSGSFWLTGMLEDKKIYDNDTLVQEESYVWQSDEVISNPYGGTHVDTTICRPVLQEKPTIRNGSTYTITCSNFDAYGRPGTIQENGDKTRTQTITYWTNSSLNIIGDQFVSQEIVTIDGESIINSYDYSYYNNGKVHDVYISGVKTTYGYDAVGNLNTITDANNNTTTYSDYSYGVPLNIYNAEYPNTPEIRVVNWEGTIKDFTDREGNTVSFTYDYLNRIESIDPPVGDDTMFVYDSRGAYIQKTTGPYEYYILYDCLGQKTGTYEPVAQICSDISYDALGRKEFESYPYSCTKTITARSVNNLSQGAYSGGILNTGYVEPEPPTPTIPQEPYNVHVTNAGETYIDLSWNHDEENVVFNVGRRLQGSADPYVPVASNISVKNIRDSGLSVGTCYTYRVQAVNSEDHTYTSNWVYSAWNGACTTEDTTPPPVPNNFHIEDTGITYMRLSWVENLVGDLDGYRIHAKRGNNGIPWDSNPWYQIVDETSCPRGTTTWLVTSLLEGEYYKFRIQSIDINNNESSWVELNWAQTNYDPNYVHPPQSVQACEFPIGAYYGLRVTWDLPVYTSNIAGYWVTFHRPSSPYSYSYQVTGASSTSFELNYVYTTGNWQSVSVQSYDLDGTRSDEVYATPSYPYANCQ